MEDNQAQTIRFNLPIANAMEKHTGSRRVILRNGQLTFPIHSAPTLTPPAPLLNLDPSQDTRSEFACRAR